MQRICVSFTDKSSQQLRMGAKERKTTLANYIRNLVDIGQQIEEAAAAQSDSASYQKDGNNGIGDLKILLENNLSWALETRYLVRFLVENLSLDNREKLIETISHAKEKAQASVEKLMQQNHL